MKDRTLNNFWAFICGVLLIFIVSTVINPAWATGKPKPAPVPTSTSSADATAGAVAGAAAGALSGSDSSAAVGDVSAVGGDSLANAGGGGGGGGGGGATLVDNGRFFALARSQPGASGCWGGVDAGGADGGGGGFLGIHLLNKDCWTSYLAEMERSVEIKARLNCGSKVYRNAIAYDVKGRKARQAACIRFVKAEYQRQIDHDNDLAQQLIREQERVSKLQDNIETLIEERGHEQRVCDERVQRCEERAFGGKGE